MHFKSLRAFAGHKGASVSIIAAITLPILIGFVALAAEFGHGLITKSEDQRIADLSAYAGALAYTSKSTTAAMTAQAQNIALLNGLASSAVAASLVASPRTPADNAVYVKISTSNVLLLAPVLRSGSSLPISANSYAQMAPTASACMLALSSSGTGVALSGGTALSSPTCTVASNSTVSVPCGTTLTAKAITYNGAVPSQPCSGISGTITKLATADPLAANTAIASAAAHASGLSSMTSPSAPTVSSVPTGMDVSFGYSGTPSLPSGCSAIYSGSTWTMTCASGGTYKFGTITLGGGQSLTIVTSGSSATTYDFSGAFSYGGTINVNVTTSAAITYNFGQAIALSYGSMSFGAGTFNFARSNNITQSIANSGGATMSFGAGTFNIYQGISNSGTSLTFGAGTFNIGSGSTNSCNGGYYSICNSSGTLTFGGPSTFVMSSGIYNAGGSTLTLGSGSSNSFNIGSTGSGSNAFVAGGGATTTFADATGTGNLFQMAGNFNVTGGGGSCVTIGAATQHDFGGYVSTAGGLTLGAGVYSVYGYIAFGANGGGDVTCNGVTTGVTGTNVTLVTAGASTISTYPCSSSALCIASGYDHVSLIAPATGTYAYLGIIGPVSSSNTAGFFLTEGAAATSLSGAVYFPYGPLTLSGGASIISSQCLQIVASQISLSGGTSATASNCFSGSSAGASVKLVQ